MLERTHATIDTLHRLERHRGHFYNWYETRTLRPLIPLYVSSVDSGNLAGHLLTLACGLRELAEEKILDPQIFAGLRDTLALVQGLAGENALLSQLDAELAQTPSDLRAAAMLLQRAVEQSAKISNALANRDNLEGVALDSLIREMVEDCRIEAQHDVQVKGSNHLELQADRELLRRALENVFRNAIRHAPPGTSIEVSLSKTAGRASISVRDYGPGVPADDLTNIFKPFFRADSSRDASTGGVGSAWRSLTVQIVSTTGKSGQRMPNQDCGFGWTYR